MSEYASLEVAGYPVIDYKNYITGEVVTIFRESDKLVCARYIESGEIIYDISSDKLDTLTNSDLDKDEIIVKAYTYTISAEVLLQRLQVLGYSLSSVKKFFERSKNELSEELFRKNEFSDLIDSSFDDWLNTYREILSKNLKPIAHWEKNDAKYESSLIRYLLDDETFFAYRFPGYNLCAFLRAFLEICPRDSLVSLDLTDLINGGWHDFSEPICFDLADEKIIILAEGSSDINVLRESLSLLYPHLSEYYAFMDFGVSNASGGASSLVATIKSFSGAGIRNRIIALFDNDTAAKSAQRGLKQTNVPKNIRIMNYPDLDFTCSYPTIGPSGQANLDINGKACSIELFFGMDVLCDSDGNLRPIQWKGFDDAVQQYQGEIIDKSILQKAFFQKVDRCKSRTDYLLETDWQSIELIFEKIFVAFEDIDL